MNLRLALRAWRALPISLIGVYCCAVSGIQATPNPYGVAGWGKLQVLGMPADCLDYNWNWLQSESLVQVCRPNHYYEYLGISVRWWGWNQNTGQINDPVQFAAWVSANPGRVWIIGNEPDVPSQDGLTREQYAAMYKTYHDFISQLDPTARFCIAGIAGGSTASAFEVSRDWFDYVLNYYKTTYGEPMPVDIWNIHSYLAAKQIEDPDKPIQDFVEPFVNWCHTVDGQRYAGAEVWITELPIGEWMGALNQNWIIWFAERYLPRLEKAGIARWFWFVSSAGDGWENVALVNTNGSPSPLGQAYSALANSYPNSVIPVEPYIPAPTPQYFANMNPTGPVTTPWLIKAGDWIAEAGAIRQRGADHRFIGETCVLQYRYSDFNASLQMRVNTATNTSNWVGLSFHLGGRFETVFNSGYSVYMRRNGTIGLFNSIDGTMQEVPSVVADASQWQNVRIQMTGWRIQVWVNGVLVIDKTDAEHRYAEGYIALQSHKTDSSYRDIRFTKLPNTPSVQQPTLSSSLNTLSTSWAATLPPWGTSAKQYAIGTSPGATNIVPWTAASDSQITASNLSLNLGTTYYFSVRFQDTSGVWSGTGTGGGTTIVPPMGTSPVAQAKMQAVDQVIGPFMGLVSAGNGVLGSYIYIQDFDRTSGIRVLNTSGLATGDIVWITGMVKAVGLERCIFSTEVHGVRHITEPEPLHLATRNLAGGDGPENLIGQYQIGAQNGIALNNVGLLVTVHGRVTGVQSLSFSLWDGSAWDTSQPPLDPYGNQGVQVLSRGLASVGVGTLVRVTGISSLVSTPQGPKPRLLMRDANDLQILASPGMPL